MATTDWGFFDAVCTVGRHSRLQPGGPHTADDLIESMDHFGIRESLVLDSLGREHHGRPGNRRVLDVTAGRPRLHRAWTALAPGTDEQPDPAALVAEMRHHHVGALFLLPRQFRFPVADWCVDALLEPLAEARAPVFINYDETAAALHRGDQTAWDEVVGLCRRWPALPVVVTEYRIRRGQRAAYRAMDACANLRIELSGWWLHRGIEYITRRWGPGRLVFGSNWPTLGPHQTLATLACAEIDDADKRCIAGDNLRELLAWSDDARPEVTLPEPADAFAAFGRTGERPAELTFQDCHGHIGPEMAHYHVSDGDLDSVVGELARLGVTRSIVFGFSGVTGDECYGNDLVAEAVRRYPDQFVGFTLLNPHRGEAEMLHELKRGAAMGLRGVKLIPHYQGYPSEGPLIDVACRWAHERRQVILNHHWGSAGQVERLVSTYPGACFIAGHTTTEYAELMRRHANLFVCSCPLLEPRTCERVVETVGADRLLFGSDLTDLPVAWGLGPILFARLPADDKRLILGGNLERILERYSLRP